MPVSHGTIVSALKRSLVSSTALAALLVAAGLLVFPASRAEWQGTLPGIAGVGLMLVIYALLGRWGADRLERTDRRLLGVASTLGLIAATIYVTEIVLEYVFLPRDNTHYGYVEFGLVFLCYFSAGFVAGVKTRRVGNGLKVAVGAALIATLAWYIVLLATTYVMKGTQQQAAVFRAEGNLDDFARSGTSSFEAWLMQDFLGAGFYHLLLSLIVSAALGSLGGAIGRIVARVPKPAGSLGRNNP